MQVHTCNNIYIYIHTSTFMNAALLADPPLLSSLPIFNPLARVNHPFSTYLEILLLVIMVQISIHSHPWLVINCSPLASLPFLETPHGSCYMFT
jgi:hypothetical protein